MSNAYFDMTFAASRVMLILRGLGPDESLRIATAAWDRGVRSVEVPQQTPEDVETLGALAREAHRRGLTVGAGTILDADQIAAARRAGAAFLVAPGWDSEIVAASLALGMPILPGVATASEISAARRLGLSWLKIFPASELGPRWIRAMRGPFPDMSFVATGGVDAATAPELLTAGARVVAFGSAVSDPPQLDALWPLLAPST